MGEGGGGRRFAAAAGRIPGIPDIPGIPWICFSSGICAGNAFPPLPASLRGVVALGDIQRWHLGTAIPPPKKKFGKRGRVPSPLLSPLPESQVGIFLEYFPPSPLPRNPWDFEESMELWGFFGGRGIPNRSHSLDESMDF